MTIQICNIPIARRRQRSQSWSRLLICSMLYLYVCPGAVTAQILNNSNINETSEDSVTITVLALDSLGAPSSADSFYVVVFSGGVTNSAVFADSGTTSMAGLDSARIGGLTYYYYRRKTADIDGPGSPGLYSGLLIAKSTALNLSTVSRFGFQIVGWELDDIGDSAALAAVEAKAAHDTLDAGFGSLAPVTVDSIAPNAITDTAIANLAVDIDEFGGTLGSTQLETGVMDSNAIVNWIWNTPALNHTTAGTFGSHLDTKVSGVNTSGGSGAFSVTFVLYDPGANQTLPGAAVSVRNLTQSALLAVGSADNSGTVSFNVDADSFIVSAQLLGYIFPAFDTIIVTGPQTDTIYATAFDPGAPATPNLVRAWGYLTDIAGVPDTAATISAFLLGGVVRASGTIVSPFSVSAKTDTTGYFFLDLIPNAKLTPDSTRYEFTVVRSDGTILRKKLVAPDSTSWRLTW